MKAINPWPRRNLDTSHPSDEDDDSNPAPLESIRVVSARLIQDVSHYHPLEIPLGDQLERLAPLHRRPNLKQIRFTAEGAKLYRPDASPAGDVRILATIIIKLYVGKRHPGTPFGKLVAYLQEPPHQQTVLDDDKEKSLWKLAMDDIQRVRTDGDTIRIANEELADLEDLLRSMLKRNPEEQAKAAEIAGSRWMKNWGIPALPKGEVRWWDRKRKQPNRRVVPKYALMEKLPDL